MIESLPVEERAALAEVLPELVRETPEEEDAGGASPAERAPEVRDVPVRAGPPGVGRKAEKSVLESVPVPAHEHRPGAYFLRAPDAAMVPRVEEGDLLLVDPGADPEPGALVLAVLDGRATVRQVAAGGKGLLLVALDPRAAPHQGKRSDVAGVIVEVRRRL